MSPTSPKCVLFCLINDGQEQCRKGKSKAPTTGGINAAPTVDIGGIDDLQQETTDIAASICNPADSPISRPDETTKINNSTCFSNISRVNYVHCVAFVKNYGRPRTVPAAYRKKFDRCREKTEQIRQRTVGVRKADEISAQKLKFTFGNQITFPIQDL
ncbi:hypothetical protein GWI33_011568 [Rhynchophorus ferrugineus]|uniref:Uncharacterized protein n=1 Tax=Rhynchophorus ferrugineus TaxID=354439 RepID=A0A834IUF2_RHYFE|nr:hypothetical protein GWI33_011568 [Rhynchophorus ferrugineus]